MLSMALSNLLQGVEAFLAIHKDVDDYSSSDIVWHSLFFLAFIFVAYGVFKLRLWSKYVIYFIGLLAVISFTYIAFGFYVSNLYQSQDYLRVGILLLAIYAVVVWACVVAFKYIKSS